MGIILSEELKLSLAAAPNANYPIAGYRNLVTAANVSADSEDADYPASNLANPSTASQQGWRSVSTSVQYVTVDLQTTGEVDYLAVARHNFGSAQIVCSVEGTADGVTWSELVEETLLADDRPVIFRYARQGLLKPRLKLQPSGTAPRAAVLFVGQLLTFQNGLQPHTPIGMGRQRTVVPGEAESSDYLGSIVTSSRLQTGVQINALTADWVREELDDFCDYASNRTPFFWAAMPERYPREAGYVWSPNDVRPETSHLNGLASLSMTIQGIA